MTLVAWKAVVMLLSLWLLTAASAAQRADTVPVLTGDQAQVIPVLLRQPASAYPDSLRRAGVGGTVLVRTILDTTGRPEVASVWVVETADTALNASARAMVLASTFTAARVHGRRVRYLLDLPVQFDPRDASPGPPPVYTLADSIEDKPRFLRWRPALGLPAPDPADELQRLRRWGRIVVLMIIDTLGHPDSESVQIVEPWDPTLTQPIWRFLARAQFHPGHRHGRPVRVLVQMPLHFPNFSGSADVRCVTRTPFDEPPRDCPP